ncbi:hypothetical protein GX411_06585 [Candidatus Fermentibacteria bacterium]|nr:hypothetical protein [Candidatus Fermentibacteria bacterium]
MAKLSELVEKIDETARSGDRQRAIKMIESLLEKAPGNQALLARKTKYEEELKMQLRIESLEKKFGTGS